MKFYGAAKAAFYPAFFFFTREWLWSGRCRVGTVSCTAFASSAFSLRHHLGCTWLSVHLSGLFSGPVLDLVQVAAS